MGKHGSELLGLRKLKNLYYIIIMSKPKLTIGMTCYRDVEGVFWTTSILRQFHVPITNKEVEILIIDDEPNEQKDLRHVAGLAGARYVHHSKNRGPAQAKRSVFEHAEGEYTLLVDCHVLCMPNSINYLLHGIENNRIGKDIWSGPLVNEHGAIYATELDPKWRGEFFSIWHTDPEIKQKKIKEIFGMGSAFFCVNTRQFLDNELFPIAYSGFGGEECISSELNRQRVGGKHLCHSALAWQHRFLRQGGVPYALLLNDKFKNYLIGFYKCGWNCQNVIEYFSKKLPKDQVSRNVTEVMLMFPDLLIKTANGKVFEWLD